MQIINIFQTFFGGQYTDVLCYQAALRYWWTLQSRRKWSWVAYLNKTATRPLTFMFLLYEETNCRRPVGRTKTDSPWAAFILTERECSGGSFILKLEHEIISEQSLVTRSNSDGWQQDVVQSHRLQGKVQYFDVLMNPNVCPAAVRRRRLENH